MVGLRNAWLMRENTYPRRFRKGNADIETWYSRYVVIDKETRMWSEEVNCSTKLAHLLDELLGERKKMRVSDRMSKLFRVAIKHSRKWRVYSEAWDLLRASGKERAFDFLEEKLSVIALGEELEGRHV